MEHLSGVVALDESLSVRDVDKEHLGAAVDEILAAGDSAQRVGINMSELLQCDACAVQYLISLSDYYQQQGHELVFVDASDAFIQTLGLLGLSHYIPRFLGNGGSND